MVLVRATFISFVAVGCSNPTGESTSTKSLERLAANGEVIETRCAAAPNAIDKEPLAQSIVRFQTGMDPQRRASLEASVSQALKAVPDSLQRLLVKLGGDIRVTADVDAICSASFSAPGSRAKSTLQSCFVAIGSQGGKQSHLSIVVADQPLAVETSLVRAFGYFLSQYVSRLYLKSDGQLELRSAVNADLAKKMTDLTDTFVAEVQANGRFDRQRFDTWVKATPALALAGYVYAEAYDSWHCHPFGGEGDSRARMKATFPKTAALYAALEANVEKQLLAFVRPLARKNSLSLQEETPAADTTTPLIDATPDISTADIEPSTPSAEPTTPTSGATTPVDEPITVTIVDDSGSLDADDITVTNPTDEDVVVNIVPGTPPAAGDTVVTTGGTQPDTTTTPPPTNDVPPADDLVIADEPTVTNEPPVNDEPTFDIPQNDMPPADSGNVTIDSFPPDQFGDPAIDGGSAADFGGWGGAEGFAGC